MVVMFSCSHVLAIQNDVTNNENKALHSDMDYSNAMFDFSQEELQEREEQIRCPLPRWLGFHT